MIKFATAVFGSVLLISTPVDAFDEFHRQLLLTTKSCESNPPGTAQCRLIAGPTCSRTLAEHGADVLRVSGPDLPFVPGLVVDTGFGKRAAEIDLNMNAGRTTLKTLASNADIFVQSYRPGSLAQKGFSPEELAALNPGIIYTTLSAWSHVGDWAERRGYDSIVTCATGMALQQGKNGVPAKIPCQPLDYISGFLAAFGTMVAVLRRANEGGSYRVRVSLSQTAEWIWRLGLMGDGKSFDPNSIDHQTLMKECDSAYGKLHFLPTALEMSETPPACRRTPVPLGHNDPCWD